jgi:hypothetical protein
MKEMMPLKHLSALERKILLIAIVLRFYIKTKKPAALYALVSFYFLLMSELILTMYSSIYDFDNITGHIFKVLNHLFGNRYFQNKIYRGFDSKLREAGSAWGACSRNCS